MSDNRLLEDEFYAKKFYFSYGSLNKLMRAPQLFYKDYVLKQREQESTPATLEGKLIHCLLLDRDSFDQHFILLPGSLPSDNPKKIVDTVFSYWLENKPSGEEPVEEPQLEDFEPQILDILKHANLHQSLKTDAQRLEKILTDTNKEYFSFLVRAKGKDVVDIATMEHCAEIAELLENHEDVRRLLRKGGESDSNVQVFNELALEVEEIPGHPFGIKGILDNLVIDHNEKIIYINDLKTTSKTLVDFQETVEFYSLWMQAALYTAMVAKLFLIDNNMSEEWKIKFTFIVVDKYKQIYPFEVSEDTLVSWGDRVINCFEKAAWHYTERRYDLPYDLARGKVIL